MTTHWGNTPLGQVLIERQEKPTEEDLSTGSIRIVSKIAFNDGKIQLREDSNTKTGMILIRPGDLVISGINAAKGAIAIYDEGNTDPIAATIHYGSYMPNKSRVDVKYLWWLLRSNTFRELLNCYVPGGIKTELKAKRLLPIPVPLPSLPEQQCIVAKIEKIFTKIQEALNLFNSSIVEYEALIRTQTESMVNVLSCKYPLGKLIDLVESDRGISYGVVLTGMPYAGGIPTLRAGDLQSFLVLLNNVKRIAPEVEAKYNRTRLQGNELLLRIRGGLGEVAVCPSEMVGGNVSREIAVIPFVKEILPRYGMYVLSAPSNQNRMRSHLRGTSYVGINLQDVRNLEIPVIPRSEQMTFVSFLDSLRERLESLKRSREHVLSKLNALLPSILDKAFKGES